MKELGDMSVEAHTNIGILTGGIVHTLVVVGEDAQYIAKGAREAGLTDDRIMEYKTSDDALESFRDFVRAGRCHFGKRISINAYGTNFKSVALKRK